MNENQRNFAERYKNKIKKITVLDNKDFKLKFGAENKSQGLILKTIEKSKITLNEFLEVEKNETLSTIVVLDQITDPQNIGSIMRSCAMFNCKAIIVAKDNSPELTPSLLKAASGAAEVVNYYRVTNLKRTLSDLKKTIIGFTALIAHL